MDFQPMTPEEMQRTMQFLLQQQAQLVADFATLAERTDRLAETTDRLAETTDGLAETTDRLAEKTDRLAETTDRLAETTDRHAQTTGRLIDVTREVADGLIGLTSVVGTLAAAQLRTDEQLRETDRRLSGHIGSVESHLNILIDMFERHLRENHGDGAGSG